MAGLYATNSESMIPEIQLGSILGQYHQVRRWLVQYQSQRGSTGVIVGGG
jgi:hypothetical protein